MSQLPAASPAFVRATLPLIAVATLLTGCRDAQLKLASEPLGDESIVAVFPADGSRHLVADVPIEVVLGEEAVGETPLVEILVDGVSRKTECTLDFGGTYAECGVISGIERAREVAVQVSVNGVTHTSTAPAAVPDAIAGWDIMEGVSVESFGAGDIAAEQLGKALESSHAFATLDGYDGSPGAYTLLVSAAFPDINGVYEILSPGFTMVIPVEVGADGNVVGEAGTAWLTLGINGDPMQALLLGVTVSGRLRGDVLTDFRLEGALPMVSLLRVADALSLGALFVAAVGMDVDHDGDGRNDATSLVFSGTPTIGTLKEWG